ncbi:ACP S-malonyltransferase [Paraneptunicella aestuarii]|uniref:ACP S-malonyltransferase n=1 Tax=Paraneptunicella aestuarii TaxID=2831148 RepID=UPI001E621877|nr:ACP S-malonyltransferase [Paraneptunicella aestuarii]UAA39165.1 ACP S-malonyltransferase [Paraneptunicella aestuarii]
MSNSTGNNKKQTALVVCPGRGTYNKDELGYLHRYHADKLHILDAIDTERAGNVQVSVRELDSMPAYNLRQHTAGENAASLIYACSKADFMAIDREKYDIVAVTGNSMGWYIALAVAQALNEANSAKLINTMGSMMAGGTIGGQSIYPIVDENWMVSEGMVAQVQQAIADINKEPEAALYESIRLGGYMVFGGNEKALKMLEQALPKLEDRYPMRLYNHAAFHTPLLDEIAVKAQQLLPASMFQKPALPLIDGKGNIWQPHSTDVSKLHDYTLGEQVNRTYDFTKAIEVSIKEFAPDKIIVLGPGATLGGSIAQTLIMNNWHDLTDKADFIACQKEDPLLLAMGMEKQRELVV